MALRLIQKMFINNSHKSRDDDEFQSKFTYISQNYRCQVTSVQWANAMLYSNVLRKKLGYVKSFHISRNTANRINKSGSHRFKLFMSSRRIIEDKIRSHVLLALYISIASARKSTGQQRFTRVINVWCFCPLRYAVLSNEISKFLRHAFQSGIIYAECLGMNSCYQTNGEI